MIMIKEASRLNYENQVFNAKIRGYEVRDEREMKPLSKDDLKLAFKQINKDRLAFIRDRKAIELKRRRYGG